MSSEQDKKSHDKKSGTTGRSLMCGVRGPGPKYPLKTLVGYNEHCITKHRSPAYSFRIKRFLPDPYVGPGPKYLLKSPKRAGITFGLLGRTFNTACAPGPKYVLPVPRPTPVTIKFKTKLRDIGCTPAPYNVPRPIPGPRFVMGLSLPPRKCTPTPGPRFNNVDPVKQKAPIYSMGIRCAMRDVFRSPGPKYLVETEKQMPKYSFGIKHSECSPPYVLECDDLC